MPDIGERLLKAYVGLAGLAAPLGRLIVRRRRRSGKEHAERWRERFGQSGEPSVTRPTAWIHAASVGEAVAVLPLAERLAATGLRVVMTTVTVTSAEVVGRRAIPGLVHQFVPLDLPAFVDRFLDHWQPQLAVFVESEIWPVAIERLARRRIPLVVSNARMSERSLARWRRAPALARAVFGRMALCLAQTPADRARFEELGAPRVVCPGNIKFDAPVPEASAGAAAALGAAMAGRPVLLAASTHPGEEAPVLDAFEALAERFPDLLAVVVPRHPERGSAVMSLAVERRLEVTQRSAGALPSPGASVYVADTVGELGTFYRHAAVAFVGGSLVPVGGHNPIEPARFGVAVVTGPQVANFAEIYAALLADGAAVSIPDGAALADALGALLADPVRRGAQVDAAHAVVTRYTGALDRTWQALEPIVQPLVIAARLHDRRGER